MNNQVVIIICYITTATRHYFPKHCTAILRCRESQPNVFDGPMDDLSTNDLYEHAAPFTYMDCNIPTVATMNSGDE